MNGILKQCGKYKLILHDNELHFPVARATSQAGAAATASNTSGLSPYIPLSLYLKGLALITLPWTMIMALPLLIIAVLLSPTQSRPNESRQVLVYGGNGFIGAGTVELFLQRGDNVTIVNRGNWYWDSASRIQPHVRHITCDRKSKTLESCNALVAYVEEVGRFDVVVDFSAYAAHEIKEAAALLKDKVNGLYIYVSTDSVYDVCDKLHDGPSRENDAVRPQSPEDVERLSQFHSYGHHKLEAEEALIQQRLEGGFPFVMLRLPDVIGPRDTTYRFWMYQIWTRLASVMDDHPVLIPHFLDNYPISFVYSEDVSKVILQVTEMGPQIRDQVINLAYENSIALQGFLDDVIEALGIEKKPYVIQDAAASQHLYFYPSVRKGPVSVEKATSLLRWSSTPWEEVIRTSVSFYEAAMTNNTFQQQRDDVIQVLANYIFADNRDRYFKALEDVYKIDLRHFTNTKDEL